MVKSKSVLGACCTCCDTGGIWFVHEALSILFYYEFDLKKIVFYRIIPCEEINIKASFGAMLYESGKVYLLSNAQKKCFVYNVNNDEFFELKIKNICLNAFRGICVKDDYVYVFPYRYDKVVKINKNDYCVEYLETWRNVIGCDGDFYINSCNRVDKDSFIMAIPGCYKALKYNIFTEKWEVVTTNDTDADYTNFVCINQKKYYGFNQKRKTINKLDMHGTVLKSVEVEYEGARIVPYHNFIILDPRDDAHIDIYTDDLVMYKRCEIGYEESDLRMPHKCLDWVLTEDKCCAFDKSNKLIVIDKDLKIMRDDVVMDEKMYKKMLAEICENTNLIYKENEMINLGQFIQKIK